MSLPAMPDDRNTSFWLQTAPRFSAAPMDLPERAVVLILGVGIMGSSLAYHLAMAGRAPLVLERNPHPAGGATGRNGGLRVGGPAQSYNATALKLGRDAARPITALTRLNQHFIVELLAPEAINARYAVTGLVAVLATPLIRRLIRPTLAYAVAQR
jgi:glycine/D-amino acid oxidase-like deaminating enzyme